MREELKAVVESREFEGMPFKVLGPGSVIRPGMNYLAQRNTGVKLLTCSSLGDNCIHPMEVGYSYDTHECVAIELTL